jgi:hypothetical protein
MPEDFNQVTSGASKDVKIASWGSRRSASWTCRAFDAGDWWWPRKLEAQLAFHAAHPELAFAGRPRDLFNRELKSQHLCYFC